MRYLGTGIAEFIGSTIIATKLSQGHKVYIIDNLQTGYRSTIPPKGAIFIRG